MGLNARIVNFNDLNEEEKYLHNKINLKNMKNF